MAMMGNPYAKYQDSKILTASPAELTLMLYDGIIKFTNIGITAIENREFQKANTNIMKAERIVDHLSATLNDKYPVSNDFRNVYSCIMQALIQGNMKKDVAELERALEYSRMIRDTWKDVMKTVEKEGNVTNELQLLIESLEKKKGILKDILTKSRLQGEIASPEKFDAEQFDLLVDEKSELLIQMDEMDKGFDATFNRIREELLSDKDTYKKEIACMQKLIKETVNLGAQIHATEVRTKESVERALKSNRQELLKRRTSSKSVRDYYKANSQLDFVGSYFIDQKK